MDILVVGTGAMACWFAAHLARAGRQVGMLGTWAAGVEALRSTGVCLVDAAGRMECYPVLATTIPAEIKNVRLALVLVKSWQTSRAASQLAGCLVPDGLAVTLQNGLENRETLADVLGNARVAAGVTTYGATLEAPGRARVGGEGKISLEAAPGTQALAGWLQGAGLEVEVTPDVRSLVWGKLVVNAAINPLAALLRVPNGELLERPTARALMVALAKEVAAVAQAQGISLAFTDPGAVAEEVARKTARNYSSMLQDVLRGSPTEIDAINGAVVRIGARLGVPTPVNQCVWQLVCAL